MPVSASHTFTVWLVELATDADDAFAVGAERHAGDLVRVSLEREQFRCPCPRPTPSPSCPRCR